MGTNLNRPTKLHARNMNHAYDSQLKVIKDYWKNIIQYHRHNHNHNTISLSLHKKISKINEGRPEVQP